MAHRRRCLRSEAGDSIGFKVFESEALPTVRVIRRSGNSIAWSKAEPVSQNSSRPSAKSRREEQFSRRWLGWKRRCVHEVVGDVQWAVAAWRHVCTERRK